MGVVALTFAVSEASERVWGPPVTLGASALAVLALVAVMAGLLLLVTAVAAALPAAASHRAPACAR